jgi:hypothetical protein
LVALGWALACSGRGPGGPPDAGPLPPALGGTDDGGGSDGGEGEGSSGAGSEGGETGGGSSSSSAAGEATGSPPEGTACPDLALRWVDLGDGLIEVDFDEAGERPPAWLWCGEPEIGRVELEVEGEAFNVDLGVLVGGVPMDALALLIGADASIGSYAIDEPALTSGALDPGIELSILNVGRIEGAGGAGGHGGVCGVPSTAGGHGGVALELWVDATVTLQAESDGASAAGMVWGGGGGGGGGGDGCDEVYCGGLGAGGGGAGSLPGSGGDATMPSSLPSLDGTGTCGDHGGSNAPGDDGTWEAGGLSHWDGHGGDPGMPGRSGHPGAASFQTTAGQAGGAPGCALVTHGANVALGGGDVRPAIDEKNCFAGEA